MMLASQAAADLLPPRDVGAAEGAQAHASEVEAGIVVREFAGARCQLRRPRTIESHIGLLGSP